MEKLYSKPTENNPKFNLKPKRETVDFLLKFSQATQIKKYKSLEFETNLN